MKTLEPRQTHGRFGKFSGIVIDEEHGVCANPQYVRYLADTVRLATPGDGRRRKILQP